METQIRKGADTVRLGRRLWLFAIVVSTGLVFPRCLAADDHLDSVLERTAKHVASFLEVMSETNCTERVVQEKLAADGKVIEKEASTYDYLIMISTEGGDLNLVESRLVAGDAKRQKKARSALLISNGFSTLFLVFHPYYAAGFQFAREGEESVDGLTLTKIHFQHIPGMRSPAALAVRGREYPLDFQGTAFVDAQTGVIHRLTANLDSGMEDVGLRSLHSEIKFALVTFHDPPESFWLPAEVLVDVQTAHQHWRNTHEFSSYRRFAVNTKEQVAKQ
jgi:hypothetical protein